MSLYNDPGIYVIENSVNGHRYVGSSVRVPIRLRHHLNSLRRGDHINCHLQSAWNKYGENAFKFLFLMTCPKSDLETYEQELIDAWKPEYNLSPTAGNILGFKLPSDAKRKIAESKIGKRRAPFSESWMKHLKESKSKFIGVKFSDEHRRKMSESRKGKGLGKLSDETRMKMSIAHRGKSTWNKGKHYKQSHPRSDEHRLHLSEALKRICHDASA